MDIAKIRKQLKLSKYAFAQKLGVKWSTVHFWERGMFQPNTENQKKILQLFPTEKGGKR